MSKQGNILEYGTMSINALANPKFTKESTDIWNTILVLISQVQHLQKKNSQAPFTRLPTKVKKEIDYFEDESVKEIIIQELKTKIDHLLKETEESKSIISFQDANMRKLTQQIDELKGLNEEIKSENADLIEAKRKLKAETLNLNIRLQQVKSENDLLKKRSQLQIITEKGQNNVDAKKNDEIWCSPTEAESETSQNSVEVSRAPLKSITNNILPSNRLFIKQESNRKQRTAHISASFSNNFIDHQIAPIKLEKCNREPSLELEFSNDDREEEASMEYDAQVKKELNSSILNFSEQPSSSVQSSPKAGTLIKTTTIEDSQMEEMLEYGEPLTINPVYSKNSRYKGASRLQRFSETEVGSETETETETGSEDEETPILDLSYHPIRGGNWWPEDFKPNEVVNDGYDAQFKIRRVAGNLVHPVRKFQNDLQNKYLQEYAMKDFNRLAGPGIAPKTPTLTRKTEHFPTPVKTPETAFKNPNIDSVFKFQINEKNYHRFKNHLNLNSKRVPTELEVDDESPPGHERSDFPTTQQVLSDKEKSLKREKIKALQRLFQAVCVVQPDYEIDHNGKKRKYDGRGDLFAGDYGNLGIKPNSIVYEQVGNFVFKNEKFNKAIRDNNFKIDETIFYDSDNV